MIDGMKIKQQMQFDQAKGEYTGFVNLGQQYSNDTDALATEALVFLAVGVTGHWKQVIGYFLINGISADLQKELVLYAISNLKEVGVSVRALTLDGLKANMSMLKKLGCSIEPENIKSHFETAEGDTIYCFIDACHCLKLVRNAFCHVSRIDIPGVGQARWSHIVGLNTLQKKEGLSAANKLSDRHIHFKQQVMRVSTCIQNVIILCMFLPCLNVFYYLNQNWYQS